YAESLVLNRPEAHEGLSLEATKGATFQIGGVTHVAVAIRNVPHVRVSGFRFREKEAIPGTVFVLVTHHTPGTVLEDLDMQGGRTVNGVNFATFDIAQNEAPVVVKHCTIDVGFDAIMVRGPVNLSPEGRLVGGVLIRDNRISGKARGVMLLGAVSRVQVGGNR